MSRTDKDLPYWMLSKTWEPNHVACEHALWRRGRRECDLPDSPVMERPIISRWRSNTPTGCYWSPTWDHFWRPAEKGVPTWYVRLEFTGPERRGPSWHTGPAAMCVRCAE
jgi:hypothetical protein